MRLDGRQNNALRPVQVTMAYQKGVPGSVLIEQGDTRVVCSAVVEDRVPAFIKNTGKGWITAEYAMLPGSSGKQRIAREKDKTSGRSSEIQRFVGRALRTVIDLASINGYTIQFDADVIQADGSTRCAALNGSILALAMALRYMVFEQMIADFPAFHWLAAVSLGIQGSDVLVDLNYQEDATIDMDINFVSRLDHQIVEISAFAEGRPVAATLFGQVLNGGLEANQNVIEKLQAAAIKAGIHV